MYSKKCEKLKKQNVTKDKNNKISLNEWVHHLTRINELLILGSSFELLSASVA